MKAVMCRELGPPEILTIEEGIDPPELVDDGVRIAVHAAGLNFPDVLTIAGQYQTRPPLPFIPGAEVGGEVMEVGPNVTRFKAGDRVMGIPSGGAIAEQAVVAEDRVHKIPDSMSFESAAGFGITYGTSMHALKQRGRLKAGETLLVLGASGGVGLAAVEIGKAMGARVIGAAGSDEKLEIVKQHGADELVNYTTGSLRDEVKALTGGNGADVIYDAVGGDMFDEAIRCINWEGRILIVGFASGRIPDLPVNYALLKGCEIVGVFWGRFAAYNPDEDRKNFDQLFSWYEEGKLPHLISQVYPMDNVVEALNCFVNRTAVGKIVLKVR